jgi:hypothetical protein
MISWFHAFAFTNGSPCVPLRPGAPEYDPVVHPLMIFDGLTLSEIDELRDDLRVYLDLDHKAGGGGGGCTS